MTPRRTSAYVIYTSGSHRPAQGRGDARTRGVCNCIAWRDRAPTASAPATRAPAFASIAFDLAIDELLPLLVGRPVHLVPTRHASRHWPRRWWTIAGAGPMQRSRPTHLPLVDAGADAGRRRRRPRTRWLIGGDGARRRADALLAGACAGRAPDERLRAHRDGDRSARPTRCRAGGIGSGPVPIGRPIAEPARLRAGPPGSRCRWACRASCTSAGRAWRAATWDAPALTAERFVPDPFGATPARGCTARATGRGGWRTAICWSSWAGSTSR